MGYWWADGSSFFQGLYILQKSFPGPPPCPKPLGTASQWGCVPSPGFWPGWEASLCAAQGSVGKGITNSFVAVVSACARSHLVLSLPSGEEKSCGIFFLQWDGASQANRSDEMQSCIVSGYLGRSIYLGSAPSASKKVYWEVVGERGCCRRPM